MLAGWFGRLQRVNCVHLVVCGVITLVALVFLRSTSCCSASSQPPEGLFRLSKSMWLSTGIRPCSRSRRQFLIVHSRVGWTFSNCRGDSGSRWGGRYFYNHFINQILTVQCTLGISLSLVHNSDRMPIGHPHSSPGRGRYLGVVSEYLSELALVFSLVGSAVLYWAQWRFSNSVISSVQCPCNCCVFVLSRVGLVPVGSIFSISSEYVILGAFVSESAKFQ